MRYFASILTTVTWGLWFGGLIALFLFVQTLFHNNREIATVAAPQLFMAFQKYHLILAVIALAGTVIWRIAVPSRAAIVLFVLLAIAACAGVAIALWIIEPMEKLREAGQSGSDEFKRLHGRSMMLYVTQAIMLLAGGITLVMALRDSHVRTSRQTAQA